MDSHARFQALQQDGDDLKGSDTVYKWEQGTSAWNDTDGDNLALNQLNTLRTQERERLNKAKLRRITPSVRRGLIRFLFIALDCSASAEVTRLLLD